MFYVVIQVFVCLFVRMYDLIMRPVEVLKIFKDVEIQKS